MSEQTAPAGVATPPLSREARTVALIVAAAFFMQLLDATIITTSLPQMAAAFGVQSLELSIGVTIYLLSMAIFIPISGWLADRYGSRNVFLVALALFTLASVWVGASRSLPEFVAARAVQGLGGALMTPVGRIIVLRSARKSELLQAIALISWPALFAPVIGPVIGGVITTYVSWRWNFFINVPLGLAGLVLVLRFIPNGREASPRKLDVMGFVLTAAALAALLYGLEAFVHSDRNFAPTIVFLATGLGLGTLAVRHLASVPVPLLELSVFGQTTFRMSTLSAGLVFRTAIAATPFLLPLLFQVVFGLTPLAAGGYLLVYFLGNLAMKTVTTPVIRRYGFRHVLVANGILCAGFLAGLAAIGGRTPDAIIFALLFASGLTRSMQFTALNSLGFADISAEQRSSASTLASMLQQVSMVLGVAVAAAILNGSQLMRGGTRLALADFHIVFFAIGLMTLLAALTFLKLSAGAGGDVSNHRS